MKLTPFKLTHFLIFLFVAVCSFSAEAARSLEKLLGPKISDVSLEMRQRFFTTINDLPVQLVSADQPYRSRGQSIKIVYPHTSSTREGQRTTLLWNDVEHTVTNSGIFPVSPFRVDGIILDDRRFYMGQIFDKKASGVGKEYFANGQKYEGELKNNMRNGKGALYYTNGPRVYEGEWKDNLRHGEGTLYNANGQRVYEGEWKTNQMHGKGTLYLTNGKPRYEGEWKTSQMDGKGTLYDANGKPQYEGEWKNNMRNGEGTLYYKSGKPAYEGDWADNKMHGKGTLYYKSGKPQYEGDWADDKKHGQGVAYNDEGQWCYKGGFCDNKQHGLGASYDGGRISHDIWDNGSIRPKSDVDIDSKIHAWSSAAKQKTKMTKFLSTGHATKEEFRNKLKKYLSVPLSDEHISELYRRFHLWSPILAKSHRVDWFLGEIANMELKRLKLVTNHLEELMPVFIDTEVPSVALRGISYLSDEDILNFKRIYR